MLALAAFYAMLGQDSARAFYGPGHVRAAAELGAIQTLLLSDTLFRVNDVAKVCAAPLGIHEPARFTVTASSRVDEGPAACMLCE